MTSTRIVNRRRRQRYRPNRPDGRTWIAPDVDEIFARLWPRQVLGPDQVNGRNRIRLEEAA